MKTCKNCYFWRRNTRCCGAIWYRETVEDAGFSIFIKPATGVGVTWKFMTGPHFSCSHFKWRTSITLSTKLLHVYSDNIVAVMVGHRVMTLPDNQINRLCDDVFKHVLTLARATTGLSIVNNCIVLHSDKINSRFISTLGPTNDVAHRAFNVLNEIIGSYNGYIVIHR